MLPSHMTLTLQPAAPRSVFALRRTVESHPLRSSRRPPWMLPTFNLQLSTFNRCVFNHFPALSFSVACKSFVCHSYTNCRGVAQLFPFWNSSTAIRAHLCRPTSFSARTLCSLFSLFVQRVFHNPSEIKKIRTLSKNAGVYGFSSHFGMRHSPAPSQTECLLRLEVSTRDSDYLPPLPEENCLRGAKSGTKMQALSSPWRVPCDE